MVPWIACKLSAHSTPSSTKTRWKLLPNGNSLPPIVTELLSPSQPSFTFHSVQFTATTSSHPGNFHSHEFFPQPRRLAPRPRNAYAHVMARPDCPKCGGTGWKIIEGERELSPAVARVPELA